MERIVYVFIIAWYIYMTVFFCARLSNGVKQVKLTYLLKLWA